METLGILLAALLLGLSHDYMPGWMFGLCWAALAIVMAVTLMSED